VHYYPLPSRIVEIYPEWRGYDFIYVHGRYIILRPETHEIVYIIESGARSSDANARAVTSRPLFFPGLR
jgi:hypothetical protein